MNMTLDEQRSLALQYAKQMKASKTLEILKDDKCCYEDILAAALAELGPEKLVSVLLENQPVWALNALRYLPSLSYHREALLKKAAILNELPDVVSMPQVAPALSAHTLPSISELELSLVAGVGYAVHSFTMWWTSPFAPKDQTWQPMKGDNDPKDWIRSGGLNLGDSATLNCSKFAIKEAPLNSGDIVTMVVDIKCNPKAWAATNLFFTYIPDSNAKAVIKGKGPVDGPTFSWSIEKVKT